MHFDPRIKLEGEGFRLKPTGAKPVEVEQPVLRNASLPTVPKNEPEPNSARTQALDNLKSTTISPTDTTVNANSPNSFKEFFPIYLRGHSDPRNRAVHYLCAYTFTGITAAGLATGNLWLPLAAVLPTYGVLWTAGHMLFEGNMPVTFKGAREGASKLENFREHVKNWFFSMCSEFYMTWRFTIGKLGEDLKNYKIETPKR